MEAGRDSVAFEEKICHNDTVSNSTAIAIAFRGKTMMTGC